MLQCILLLTLFLPVYPDKFHCQMGHICLGNPSQKCEFHWGKFLQSTVVPPFLCNQVRSCFLYHKDDLWFKFFHGWACIRYFPKNIAHDTNGPASLLPPQLCTVGTTQPHDYQTRLVTWDYLQSRVSICCKTTINKYCAFARYLKTESCTSALRLVPTRCSMPHSLETPVRSLVVPHQQTPICYK